MKLELSVWTHHLNHLLYSYFYYCLDNNIDVKVLQNTNIKHNTALLTLRNITILFDYSDDVKFLDIPDNYDFYFKRSLCINDKEKNIYPLNFNVPLTYKSYWFLLKVQKELLLNKSNRNEVLRALDLFGLFASSAHSVLDIRRFPKRIIDNGGKIIYYTRLWNPENHPDETEKERRMLQNEFRINACRLIKKEYKNAAVGLFGDDLSNRMAPDLVLSSKESNKKNYLTKLTNSDIGIVDDGLKDTPGWKIGEYLLYGKAVVSTPLNVCVDDFKEHLNYEKLESRSSYQELPEKISFLLKDKKYNEMAHNNLEWSNKFLHPHNYLKRILDNIDHL